MEKRELSYTVIGNINVYNHDEEEYGDSFKNCIQNYHMIPQTHSKAYICKNQYSKRYIHPSVHC